MTGKSLIITSRNKAYTGKPSLIYTSSLAGLSKTQSIILDRLNHSDKNYIFVNRARDKLKITMKDLSALTASELVEFALFRRPDKYCVIIGGSLKIIIGEELTNTLINGKYKWIGHTHIGGSLDDLRASQEDYDTLAVFNQRQSMIYNAFGKFSIFSREV